MKGYWNITKSTIPITLSVFFLFIYNQVNVVAAPTRHLCRPEQREALVELKRELEVFISPFGYNCYVNGTIVTPHPKTESWELNNDCCTWEGITCNVLSGEVIKLDLSCSYLRGQLHSSINLHSLTALDLSSNDFSGQIMSSVGNLLPLLTSLDLSYNRFSGQIPSSIGNLSHLSSLDLSDNQLSGQLPSWIGNLSHLTQLDLSRNNFSGQIPSSIGKLPQLTFLVLSSNQLVGQIPSSFGNLNHLLALILDSNMLNGNFPIPLLNMTMLSYISLHGNHFTGPLPPNVTSLSKLTFLDAANNAFTGTIPSHLLTLPSLQFVRLQKNQLNGTLDFRSMSSPSFLRELDLGNNNLIGPIPSSISKLTNLQYLDLSSLNTQGPVNFTAFSHLKSLYYLHLPNLNTTTTVDLNYIMSCFKSLYLLDLSGNHVSVTNKISSVPYLLMQPIQSLLLSGCGITEFPSELLKTKQLLTDLDISNNKLKGQVPGWLWTLPYLRHVDLSNNNLISFERSTRHGGPSSMMALLVSNNNLAGEIPSFLCDLPSLRTLDLSNNNFSGLIPPCFRNLKRALSDLNLGQNRLHGALPEYIFESLRSLDVGHNQLTGKLPRALVHSSYIEVLNVGNNVINDTFTFWLSSLPTLKVLVLRSNAFHGPILQASFPKLQIIDISHNHFNGALPSDYLVKWKAMSSLGTNEDKLNRKYMGDVYYYDSLVLMNKGVVMELVRILKIYTALDFSRNKLEGKIPRSIGFLKELHVLNLSNNAFTGRLWET